MGWLQQKLGYGKSAVIDLDDPANPPRTVNIGMPITFPKFIRVEMINAEAGFAFQYQPVSSGKVLGVHVSARHATEIDLLFGTAGAQARFATIWLPSGGTWTYNFPGHLQVASTQILQLNIWNRHTEAQDINATMMINE